MICQSSIQVTCGKVIVTGGAGVPVKRGLSSGTPQGAAGLRHKNSFSNFGLSLLDFVEKPSSYLAQRFHQFNSCLVGWLCNQPNQGTKKCPTRVMKDLTKCL